MDVLHVAPHPDDELLGAPATLFALRDAGHAVVNFACSLGRAADATRRRAELDEACRRARFESLVSRAPLGDEPYAPPGPRGEAERRLAGELEELLGARPFGLVVGPSPHDRHPGHEIVARALRAALEGGAGPGRWWMWGLWGGLPFPTTVTTFGPERLEEISLALSAHSGELARNDYRDLLAGRARAARVLAAELVFGFGSAGLPGPYAEAIGEVVRRDGGWLLGAPRLLDTADLLPAPAGPAIDWWLDERSAADGLRAAAAFRASRAARR
jgi:hypothetical protein